MRPFLLILIATLAIAIVGEAAELDPLLRFSARRAESASARKAPNPSTLPVIVRVAEGTSVPDWLEQAVTSRHGDIWVLRCPVERLTNLRSVPAVLATEAAMRAELQLDVSLPLLGIPPLRYGGWGYTGEGTLVGILDTGIDPLHESFRDSANHTRIVGYWDQYDPYGPAPAGYGYGREYTPTQIENGGFQDTDGHGTHVSGIAAGNGGLSGTYGGVAPKAGLLVCSTKTPDELFMYGDIPAGNTTGWLDAIDWMLAVRDRTHRPLVINLSQGIPIGPHDGTTLLEQALENDARDRNLILIVAAGNSALDNLHARTGISRTAYTQLRVAVADSTMGTNTFCIADVWTPVGNRFQVRVTSPGGEVLTFPYATYGEDSLGTRGGTAVYLEADFPSARNNKGHAVLILLNTTGLEQGTWSFGFKAMNEMPGSNVIDAFLQRNSAAFFMDSVTTENTTTLPGTGYGVITVAAYTTRTSWRAADGRRYTVADLGYPISGNAEGRICSFSGIGPNLDGGLKPDISAPGMMIASAMTSPLAGNDQLRYMTMPGNLYMLEAGTSMATPFVTGTVALMLQKNPDLPFSEVKSILQATALPGSEGDTSWTPTWGYGKLDVAEALNRVAAQYPLTITGSLQGDSLDGSLPIRILSRVAGSSRSDTLWTDTLADLGANGRFASSQLAPGLYELAAWRDRGADGRIGAGDDFAVLGTARNPYPVALRVGHPAPEVWWTLVPYERRDSTQSAYLAVIEDPVLADRALLYLTTGLPAESVGVRFGTTRLSMLPLPGTANVWSATATFTGDGTVTLVGTIHPASGSAVTVTRVFARGTTVTMLRGLPSADGLLEAGPLTGTTALAIYHDLAGSPDTLSAPKAPSDGPCYLIRHPGGGEGAFWLRPLASDRSVEVLRGAAWELLPLLPDGKWLAESDGYYRLVPGGNVPPLALHPNPARDILRITAPGDRLRLLDLTGRTVRVWPVPSESSTDLDLSSLPAGTWLLQAEGTGCVLARSRFVHLTGGGR